jgi:molybdate transport repressor ModE-like protein
MTPFERLDWDDLRLVLAIGRAGGIGPAARALGVNHSTVFRRINALEELLGAALFERQAGGYTLTPLGEAGFRAALAMEEQILTFGREAAGGADDLKGSIRLTAPDDMVYGLLLPVLAAFREKYPQLTLEVVVENRFLNLSRREADIAIRSSNQPSETMVGVNVGDTAVAGYVSASLQAVPWRDLPWIGWDEGVGPPRVQDWLSENLPAASIVYRSNSLLNQFAAAKAGIGAALLPCFLADEAKDLARIVPPLAKLTSLWILTHPDLRRAPRIQAFMGFVGDALRRQRARMAGTA